MCIIVTSRMRGMYGIFCTEAQGAKRTRDEVNKCHASQVHVMQLFYIPWAQLPWIRLEAKKIKRD